MSPSLVPSGMDPIVPGIDAAIASPPPADDQELLVNAEITPEEPLDSVRLAADEQLPADLATLIIQMDGDRHFTLLARSAAIGEIAAPPRERRELPDVSLADIARPGGCTPDVVVRRMFLWSRSVHVAQWLLELSRHDVHLEIDDSSGFEIPWEMLTLAPGTVDETYLGVALAVSRRLSSVPVPQDLCSPAPGRVLAYVADEMRRTEEKAGALMMIDADQHHDVERFEEDLRTGATNYALLYLACHGTDGVSVEDVSLGSRRRTNQRLVLGPLEYGLRKVRIRGAVFINACHSARLFKDRDINIEQGFPALFLRLGAPGVIGTVGKISSAFAAEFAAELLRDAHGSSGRTLPELLRRRRAEIVASYERSGATNTKRLVSTFMYVYYGDPSCCIAIQGAQ